MTDQFSMFPLMISEASPNGTSSLALADGAEPSASPDGLTTDPCGRVALPASLSPPPGKDYPATIPATLHRILFGWSGPSAPECCLASRSPARKSSERLQSALEAALRRRLSGHGLTIYTTAWKPHVTPLGRAISRLRASARSTSGSEHSSSPSLMSGGPTPVCNSPNSLRGNGQDPMKRKNGGHQVNLQDATTLAGWPTPVANDATVSTHCHGLARADGSRPVILKLPGAAQLAGGPPTEQLGLGNPTLTGSASVGTATAGTATEASATATPGEPLTAGNGTTTKVGLIAGWATASARDWKDTAGMATSAVNPDGSERTRLDQLPRQAQLAGWPTPTASVQGSGESPEARKARGFNAGLSPMDAACLAGWPTPKARDEQMARRSTDAAMRFLVRPQKSSELGIEVHLAKDGPARLTASGTLLTGSSAGMESGGQLNPRFSAWLMRYPPSWCVAALSCPLPSRSRRKPKATPAG